MFDILIPAAHAAGAHAQGGSSAGGLFSLALPFLLLVVFYLVLIRPQMKRGKEQRQMTASLAKGDEVVINGGLAGRIAEVGEVYMTLELCENVQVKVQKSAVSSVLPKGTLKNL